MGLLLVDDSENIEMSMSKRGIEVDTLKKRVDLNGGLSSEQQKKGYAWHACKQCEGDEGTEDLKKDL